MTREVAMQYQSQQALCSNISYQPSSLMTMTWSKEWCQTLWEYRCQGIIQNDSRGIRGSLIHTGNKHTKLTHLLTLLTLLTITGTLLTVDGEAEAIHRPARPDASHGTLSHKYMYHTNIAQLHDTSTWHKLITIIRTPYMMLINSLVFSPFMAIAFIHLSCTEITISIRPRN